MVWRLISHTGEAQDEGLTIVIPALGPSFFCAPAGRCRWISMGLGTLSGSSDLMFVIHRS